MARADTVICNLYCETTIRNGKTLSKLAKLAPAPKATNSAGNAQQSSVEVEAKSENTLAERSFMGAAVFKC
jgi:hypothetical protein